MPSNIIKHDVRVGEGSKKSLEKKWDKAGKAAEKSHPDNKYALQNYIYQKMKKASVQLNAAARLMATHDDTEFCDEHSPDIKYQGDTPGHHEDPHAKVKATSTDRRHMVNRAKQHHKEYAGSEEDRERRSKRFHEKKRHNRDE
jgi:hypothetical protein